MDEPDGHAETRVVPQEVVGAVDGIDHPDELGSLDVVEPRLLAQEPVSREVRPQVLDDAFLHRQIYRGDEVAPARLAVHLEPWRAQVVGIGLLLRPSTQPRRQRRDVVLDLQNLTGVWSHPDDSNRGAEPARLARRTSGR